MSHTWFFDPSIGSPVITFTRLSQRRPKVGWRMRKSGQLPSMKLQKFCSAQFRIITNCFVSKLNDMWHICISEWNSFTSFSFAFTCIFTRYSLEIWLSPSTSWIRASNGDRAASSLGWQFVICKSSDSGLPSTTPWSVYFPWICLTKKYLYSYISGWSFSSAWMFGVSMFGLTECPRERNFSINYCRASWVDSPPSKFC